MSRSVSVVTNEGSDLSLEYDGYGRVAKKVLTREGRTILTVEYTYRNTDANSTTGQIASITIGTNGASRSYSYTYDANGNILSVSDGSNTTSYTYDKAGQLLRENNQVAGKTWVWEYDNAGNIQSRTEYAYTTGNLGAVLDTVEYQYNNDNWGDLLTSYDGNTITYDEIGNPLNDGTWEYTWEHGRQLASMTDGTVTVDYEYNADGIRTRKTVSTASDHSHIFQARVVAPTCTENGYTLHECSCGYSWQSNPVAATGHSFTTTEVEATCTAHGYTLMECACGYGYQEGSQGHTFTDTVVAPTAESNGYTLHECACGYSYQDTPVAALGITNPTANGTAANTVVYDYVYNGSSLSYLTVTTNRYGAESADPETLYFGNGTVTYNGAVYYYVTNLQGDVVAILDADGNTKVEYTYDAWGKILSISGPMADTLGAVNPLTYRGYVYDTETDLYYLESRYYDPAVERFINADALVSTGQGMLGNNMLAYCHNNPVLYMDPSGCVIVVASDATEEQREEYERAIAYLKTSETGRKLIEYLETSPLTITIDFVDDDNMRFVVYNATIYFDTNSGLVLSDGISVQSAALGLAHEMGHAAQYLDGTMAKLNGYVDPVEKSNLDTYETPIAKELGEPIRSDYNDAIGVMDMQNSTHFTTIGSRPWWHYIFFWNWGKSQEIAIEHNLD